MSIRRLLPALVLSSAVAAAACDPGGEPASPDEEFGMDGPVSPLPPPGKADSFERRGLWVNTDTRRTQVWTARNRWEDTDTPAARKAGIAWPANSGLTWDEKYALWIDSMQRTAGTSYYDTFILTTPWGKQLPAPALECAEASIFLRITFAAWYELPFFMEAVDRHGNRIFFGHNGVRTAAGRYANTPEFAVRYRDYSDMDVDDALADWPHDDSLRRRKLWGGTDEQDMLRDGATFGEYLDEIHLNKRAGHFTMLALGYLGSVNLADSANTYNIVPDAVRPGDTLLERWQRHGIGHTLVVKQVTPIGEGNLDVTVVSGSMPRRQPKWESGVASKRYFTDPRTGGRGTNYEGDEYAKLGGGLKRWRVTKNVGGYWTNTFMRGDEAHWINSTDTERIAARPEQFERLLGEVSPEDQRDALLALIEDRRAHLRNYPASCAAREAREGAFRELYDLAAREWGMTAADVDARYRTLDDYVFAELEYTRSKTCCWNSTTPAMYEIVMDYARAEQAEAEAEGVCRAPTPFMSHADGYERWRDFAEQTGRGAAWRPWSEDESCPQRDVAADTLRPADGADFCAVSPGEGGADDCADAYEPNPSADEAPVLEPGAHDGLRICDGDRDWFRIPNGGTVRISFSHAEGDLDLKAYDAGGRQVAVSQSVSDVEEVAVPAGGAVEVYGYNGATAAYRIELR
ncbi:MAG: hypothetical protein D6689_06700 [Deltaproteobacteria bacterium]|nr:MAG: hypothetical protein D6689_06700 [Deltaproteobacteria bacterium]